MSEKMPTFHYEENEQEYSYEILDSNEFLEPYDKMNIVGVCEGLKQVTELEVATSTDIIDVAESSIEDALDSLKLNYYKENRSSDYSPDFTSIQYYVAKDPKALDKMREIMRQWREDESYDKQGDIERGKLFGFPETAIDYFANRWDYENGESIATTNPKYHSYIHSPEHAEEEYERYEKKLEELFKEHCPESAEEFYTNILKSSS